MHHLVLVIVVLIEVVISRRLIPVMHDKGLWDAISRLVLTSCVELSELFAQVVMEGGCSSG